MNAATFRAGASISTSRWSGQVLPPSASVRIPVVRGRSSPFAFSKRGPVEIRTTLGEVGRKTEGTPRFPSLAPRHAPPSAFSEHVSGRCAVGEARRKGAERLPRFHGARLAIRAVP